MTINIYANYKSKRINKKKKKEKKVYTTKPREMKNTKEILTAE